MPTAPPFAGERAREASAKGNAVLKAKREGRVAADRAIREVVQGDRGAWVVLVPTANAGEYGAPPATGRPVREDDWKLLYQAQAFPGRWQDVYSTTKRDLELQYEVKRRQNAQYRILVRRVAALDTMVSFMEAVGTDPVLRLKYGRQLVEHIAQLQKYTESEKRETIVRNEILVTTLTKVISVGESTITDPNQRAAFMAALANVMTGEATQPYISLPSPTDPELDDNGDESLETDDSAVIDGDFEDLTETAARESPNQADDNLEPTLDTPQVKKAVRARKSPVAPSGG